LPNAQILSTADSDLSENLIRLKLIIGEAYPNRAKEGTWTCFCSFARQREATSARQGFLLPVPSVPGDTTPFPSTPPDQQGSNRSDTAGRSGRAGQDLDGGGDGGIAARGIHPGAGRRGGGRRRGGGERATARRRRRRDPAIHGLGGRLPPPHGLPILRSSSGMRPTSVGIYSMLWSLHPSFSGTHAVK